ncbi:hypothetical protein CGH14_21725 [Vibrio parahaemolyticus]|nr:hypothetical protein CGH14_21725 [Vibrio parahaemolyticus]
MAFLVWVWFSVYAVQMKCCGRVLHTLIGRYVLGGLIEIIGECCAWYFGCFLCFLFEWWALSN